MEKSLEGFSSHSSTYDIGIIYDEELEIFKKKVLEKV